MNRTKRRIFTTAIKLFAQNGYESTGIEEITAVAGVAKGSLYYHFETKENLFDLLLEEGRKLLYNSIEIKFKSCNNALDKLKAIIMIQIKSLIKYEDFVTVLVNNTLGENSRTKKCQKALDEYMAKIQEVVQEGIAYGIFGVNFSSLLYRLKKNRNVTAEEIYKSYIEIVIRGLTKASN